MKYHIFPQYSNPGLWANCVDPDQTPQNAASDQGLHCLPIIKQFLDSSTVCKMDVQSLG